MSPIRRDTKTLHLGHPFQMGRMCCAQFITPPTVRQRMAILYENINITNQFLWASITIVHIVSLARVATCVPCNTQCLT